MSYHVNFHYALNNKYVATGPAVFDSLSGAMKFVTQSKTSVRKAQFISVEDLSDKQTYYIPLF